MKGLPSLDGIKYDLDGKEALLEITNKVSCSIYILINSVKDYFFGNFLMLDIVKNIIFLEIVFLRNWLKQCNTLRWNVKTEEFMARGKISKSFNLNLVLQVL